METTNGRRRKPSGFGFFLILAALIGLSVGVNIAVPIISKIQKDRTVQNITEDRLEQIKQTLLSYYWRYGQFPDSLQALQGAYLSRTQLIDKWGHTFCYQKAAPANGIPNPYKYNDQHFQNTPAPIPYATVWTNQEQQCSNQVNPTDSDLVTKVIPDVGRYIDNTKLRLDGLVKAVGHYRISALELDTKVLLNNRKSGLLAWLSNNDTGKLLSTFEKKDALGQQIIWNESGRFFYAPGPNRIDENGGGDDVTSVGIEQLRVRLFWEMRHPASSQRKYVSNNEPNLDLYLKIPVNENESYDLFDTSLKNLMGTPDKGDSPYIFWGNRTFPGNYSSNALGGHLGVSTFPECSSEEYAPLDSGALPSGQACPKEAFNLGNWWVEDIHWDLHENMRLPAGTYEIRIGANTYSSDRNNVNYRVAIWDEFSFNEVQGTLYQNSNHKDLSQVRSGAQIEQHNAEQYQTNREKIDIPMEQSRTSTLLINSTPQVSSNTLANRYNLWENKEPILKERVYQRNLYQSEIAYNNMQDIDGNTTLVYHFNQPIEKFRPEWNGSQIRTEESLSVTWNRTQNAKQFIFLCEGTSCPENYLLDGLVAYFPLNNDATDLSGNNKHGTLVNTLGVNDRYGHTNTAVAFGKDPKSRKNRYLQATTLEVPTAAYTFAFWMKPEDNMTVDSPQQFFLHWGQGGRPHILFHKKSGTIRLFPNVNGVNIAAVSTATNFWFANTWYHIAFTWDGTKFRVYVNGDKQGNDITRAGTQSFASELYIGAKANHTAPFYGHMDEVMIYNRALNLAEIKTLATTLPPTATSFDYHNLDANQDYTVRIESRARFLDGQQELSLMNLGACDPLKNNDPWLSAKWESQPKNQKCIEYHLPISGLTPPTITNATSTDTKFEIEWKRSPAANVRPDVVHVLKVCTNNNYDAMHKFCLTNAKKEYTNVPTGTNIAPATDVPGFNMVWGTTYNFCMRAELTATIHSDWICQPLTSMSQEIRDPTIVTSTLTINYTNFSIKWRPSWTSVNLVPEIRHQIEVCSEDQYDYSHFRCGTALNQTIIEDNQINRGTTTRQPTLKTFTTPTLQGYGKQYYFCMRAGVPGAGVNLLNTPPPTAWDCELVVTKSLNITPPTWVGTPTVTHNSINFSWKIDPTSPDQKKLRSKVLVCLPNQFSNGTCTTTPVTKTAIFSGTVNHSATSLNPNTQYYYCVQLETTDGNVNHGAPLCSNVTTNKLTLQNPTLSQSKVDVNGIHAYVSPISRTTTNTLVSTALIRYELKACTEGNPNPQGCNGTTEQISSNSWVKVLDYSAVFSNTNYRLWVRASMTDGSVENSDWVQAADTVMVKKQLGVSMSIPSVCTAWSMICWERRIEVKKIGVYHSSGAVTQKNYPSARSPSMNDTLSLAAPLTAQDSVFMDIDSQVLEVPWWIPLVGGVQIAANNLLPDTGTSQWNKEKKETASLSTMTYQGGALNWTVQIPVISWCGWRPCFKNQDFGFVADPITVTLTPQ
ncbi:MAG: LamG domain-containing protein [SAR324 cluster bacterium]|nr:LamG domain-containing protein [SAR324 cluster bacterium]